MKKKQKILKEKYYQPAMIESDFLPENSLQLSAFRLPQIAFNHSCLSTPVFLSGLRPIS